MYTLDDLYRMKYAVDCQTPEEVVAFLEAVRGNPPPDFKDYWLSERNGGLGYDDFIPEAPTSLTTSVDTWDGEPNFGWCSREWYEDNGYEVIDFCDVQELNLNPRELQPGSFESLFGSEVTCNV